MSGTGLSSHLHPPQPPPPAGCPPTAAATTLTPAKGSVAAVTEAGVAATWSVAWSAAAAGTRMATAALRSRVGPDFQEALWSHASSDSSNEGAKVGRGESPSLPRLRIYLTVP